MAIQYENLFIQMLPAIKSKKYELHYYGYSTVDEKDIWTFCVQKKWRKKDVATMRTYEIANGILSITPAEFMTFTQIEEQRSSDWFSDINSDELQILLAPQKAEK